MVHSEIGIGKLGSWCGPAQSHHMTVVDVCSVVYLATLPPSGNCTPGFLRRISPPSLSLWFWWGWPQPSASRNKQVTHLPGHQHSSCPAPVVGSEMGMWPQVVQWESVLGCLLETLEKKRSFSAVVWWDIGFHVLWATIWGKPKWEWNHHKRRGPRDERVLISLSEPPNASIPEAVTHYLWLLQSGETVNSLFISQFDLGFCYLLSNILSLGELFHLLLPQFPYLNKKNWSWDVARMKQFIEKNLKEYKSYTKLQL